ncbi:sensor histidine kinase [Zeaxanthinibacter enoshimensis]|uniref:Histidine kinase n=1 Tax=Zeaxanthinibacter enoshimensis TaxID=392009 RepID=A0A4R6TRD3_9FLAO|nr:histidine kinase [Zeaxanthinibacter enoshimensis]TDQ31050.1 histidine kinase [Zeaxanthinibacter enoshimensis]
MKYQIKFRHHLIFWLIYFLFNTLRWGSYFNDYSYSFKANLIGFPIHMALAYLNIYVLMPRYIFRRKYLDYSLLVLGALGLMLLVKYNLTQALLGASSIPAGHQPISEMTLNYAITAMLGELYVISFVTAIKITIDWLRENSKFHALEKRQLSTELQLLKTQVSPHFFFNTLNNIYSLTLEQSPKAPQVVLKLSDMMRHLLYSTDRPYQTLHEEFRYIHNYIELQRIRYDDSLHLQWNVSGKYDECSIPPMLLIPLVENCFKHAGSSSTEPIFIEINAKVKENWLHFETNNSIRPESDQSLHEHPEKGIGLSNVRKRLSLAFRPEDYDLTISESEQNYRVLLKLKV